MSYLGNTPETQAFSPAVDIFSGNGSATVLSLSKPVLSAAQVQVVVNNVPQNPASAFTVGSQTITFTSAPSAGTNNIYVYYVSPITQAIAPSPGTVTSSSFGTITDFATTGNTVLGDATTDTLTVGVTGIVKDASGNVGIGTTSPLAQSQLTVASKSLSITGSDGNFSSGGARAMVDFAGGTQMRVGPLDGGTATATTLAFLTSPGSVGGNERMRIDSSGNVLVGTTSQIGAEQVGISFADATKNGLGIQVQASTTGAAFTVFRNSSGTLIGSITRNTTTNAVLYNTSSDYRLKENVTPLTNALARVSALKPVQWLWKDCDGVVGEGFIAHEVQDVIPAAVSGEKDAVDGEGNIKPQGMDASYLVATLTAAIQEQQALITALTARIEALENK